MKLIEIVRLSTDSFNDEWANKDVATEYVEWCVKRLNADIDFKFNNAQNVYDNLELIGKKVYKGRLKEGDIVLIKPDNSEVYTEIGFYIKDLIEDVKFGLLRAVVIDSKVVVKEFNNIYTNACFVRPNIEAAEVKPKKKKNG